MDTRVYDISKAFGYPFGLAASALSEGAMAEHPSGSLAKTEGRKSHQHFTRSFCSSGVVTTLPFPGLKKHFTS